MAPQPLRLSLIERFLIFAFVAYPSLRFEFRSRYYRALVNTGTIEMAQISANAKAQNYRISIV